MASDTFQQSCELLQERLGYRFGDPDHLAEALTHKSFANERPDLAAADNERLEFLGDAVLGLAVSDILYRELPGVPEGELTRIRAEVVNERSLAGVGRRLDLGACLRLGRGEDLTGGRDRDSLLADGLEALLGAIFRDGGLAAAQEVIGRLFGEAIAASARGRAGTDHKTRLQELLQGRQQGLPAYVLTETEGPDHQRLYTMEVRFRGEVLGRGRGRSKKAAEQEAAQEALRRLGS